MSVTAGFMVPHPPLIIPEVGRGEQREIAETIEAYHRVGKETARIKPDTIVVISPIQFSAGIISISVQITGLPGISAVFRPDR